MKDRLILPVGIGMLVLILGLFLLGAAIWKLSLTRNVSLTVVFIMAIIGPSVVFAANAYSSIEALGRNPSAAPKIMTAMVINLLFCAGVTVVSFLIVWQLYAPKG